MALNHTVKGSVNYTIEGTPTIIDGVITGSTRDNYIALSSAFDGTADCVIQYKFRISESFTGSRALQLPSSGALNAIEITEGNAKYYVGTDSNNTTLTFQFNYTFNTDIDYWIKIVKVGNNFKGFVSTNGVNFTLEKEETFADLVASSSRLLRPGRQESTKVFPGSIDLNQTYITMNGQAWFGNCPVEVKHINYGTSVGYTKVGNPTIANGVLSGGAADINSNYVQLTQALNLNANYEIQYKFKLDANAITASYHFPLQTTSTNRLNIAYQPTQPGKPILILIFVNSQNNWETIQTQNFTFAANVDYWLKLVKNNKTYQLYLSTDGSTFTLNAEKTFSDLPSDIGTPTINIGQSGTAGRVLNGSIDLKETYIKVNGDLWFYGKNYASQNIAPVPSGYTYGNTTTSAIGFVDMRTQKFTAAPGGATIGRDE